MKKSLFKKIIMPSAIIMSALPIASLAISCGVNTSKDKAVTQLQNNIVNKYDDLKDSSVIFNYNLLSSVQKINLNRVSKLSFLNNLLDSFLSKQKDLIVKREELITNNKATSDETFTKYKEVIEKLSSFSPSLLQITNSLAKTIYGSSPKHLYNAFVGEMDELFHKTANAASKSLLEPENAELKEELAKLKAQANHNLKVEILKEVEKSLALVTADFSAETQELKQLVDSITLPNYSEFEDSITNGFRILKSVVNSKTFFANKEFTTTNLKQIKEDLEKLKAYLSTTEDPIQELLDFPGHSHSDDPEDEAHSEIHKQFLRIFRDSVLFNDVDTRAKFRNNSNIPLYRPNNFLFNLLNTTFGTKIKELLQTKETDDATAFTEGSTYKKVKDFYTKWESKVNTLASTVNEITQSINGNSFGVLGKLKDLYEEVIERTGLYKWALKLKLSLSNLGQDDSKYKEAFDKIDKSFEKIKVHNQEDFNLMIKELNSIQSKITSTFLSDLDSLKNEALAIDISPAETDTLLIAFSKFQESLKTNNFKEAIENINKKLSSFKNYLQTTSQDQFINQMLLEIVESKQIGKTTEEIVKNIEELYNTLHEIHSHTDIHEH